MVNSVVVILFVLMNLSYLLKIACFAVDCGVLWVCFGNAADVAGCLLWIALVGGYYVVCSLGCFACMVGVVCVLGFDCFVLGWLICVLRLSGVSGGFGFWGFVDFGFSLLFWLLIGVLLLVACILVVLVWFVVCVLFWCLWF